MYRMDRSPSNPPLVDSHFHLFAAGRPRPGARYVPAYDSTFEDWWAAAHPVGVRRGVLVQPSFLGTDNSRLCRELGQQPQVLRGVAVVDPSCPPGRLRELHALGVRGIRLNLAGASHDLASWRGATPVWDEMAALGWHLELHTDVGALPQVVPQLPGAIPLVVDHMGKPAAASASDPTIALLKARSRHAAVHVKLSGAYRLEGRDARAVACALRDELGPTRLLWGSDWPCTTHEALADYPRLLAAVEGWVGAQAAALALTANPLALYWA